MAVSRRCRFGRRGPVQGTTPSKDETNGDFERDHVKLLHFLRDETSPKCVEVQLSEGCVKVKLKAELETPLGLVLTTWSLCFYSPALAACTLLLAGWPKTDAQKRPTHRHTPEGFLCTTLFLRKILLTVPSRRQPLAASNCPSAAELSRSGFTVIFARPRCFQRRRRRDLFVFVFDVIRCGRLYPNHVESPISMESFST